MPDHVFVWTVGDVVGLGALVICAVLFAVFYIADQIACRRKKKED